MEFTPDIYNPDSRINGNKRDDATKQEDTPTSSRLVFCSRRSRWNFSTRFTDDAFFIDFSLGFSQSSERFHDWLYNHKVFGPPLQDWSRYGVIPVRAKFIAVGTMTVSALLVITFSSTPWYGLVAMVALMGFGAGFVLTRPSKPRPGPLPSEDQSS